MPDDTWLDDDTPDADEKPDGLTLSQSQLRKLAVLAVVVALLAWATFMRLRNDDNGDERADAEDRRREAVEPPVSTTFATGEARIPIEPTCPEPPYEERAVQFTTAPPLCIEEDITYVATVETTRGDFVITLEQEHAQHGANNFVFLARWRYYDGTAFHFAVPGFGIQAGDPIGPNPGDGDPGYRIDEEPPNDQPYYPELSVTLANRYPERGTTGAQFFIVTGANGEAADPVESRIGHVTDGEGVIREIEATGNAEGLTPNELTVIESITIEERRS